MINGLILGSAQFGFNYGVTNDDGIVSEAEVDRILKLAQIHGVHTIDTASLYGKSEEVLGKTSTFDFKFITKYSQMPQSSSEAEKESHFLNAVESSLKRLNVSSIEGLLAHDVEEFFLNRSTYLNVVGKLKEKGLIKKFGVSIYHPDQAVKVLEIFTPDIIQFPMNIFDQRFKSSGLLEVMHRRGIEKHIRSVFLQGILLLSASGLDPFFNFIKKEYTEYDAFLTANGLTHIEGALKFMFQEKLVNKTIVGACSEKQLSEIIKAWNKISTMDVIDFSKWSSGDQKLINPLSWPMLKRG